MERNWDKFKFERFVVCVTPGASERGAQRQRKKERRGQRAREREADKEVERRGQRVRGREGDKEVERNNEREGD